MNKSGDQRGNNFLCNISNLIFAFLQTVEDYRQRLNGELKKNGHDVAVRFPDGYQEAPL